MKASSVLMWMTVMIIIGSFMTDSNVAKLFSYVIMAITSSAMMICVAIEKISKLYKTEIIKVIQSCVTGADANDADEYAIGRLSMAEQIISKIKGR